MNEVQAEIWWSFPIHAKTPATYRLKPQPTPHAPVLVPRPRPCPCPRPRPRPHTRPNQVILGMKEI